LNTYALTQATANKHGDVYYQDSDGIEFAVSISQQFSDVIIEFDFYLQPLATRYHAKNGILTIEELRAYISDLPDYYAVKADISPRVSDWLDCEFDDEGMRII